MHLGFRDTRCHACYFSTSCCAPFWLADNIALAGRHLQTEALFERLLALRNDAGFLSEDYDLRNRRALGNVPQTLTHVAPINSARNLSRNVGPPSIAAGARPEAE